MKYGVDRLREESEILENSEKREISDHRHAEKGFLLSGFSLTVGGIYHPSADIVEYGGIDHEDNVYRLSPRIENERHEEKDGVLSAEPEKFARRKIKYEKERQKPEQKSLTCEYHQPLPPVVSIPLSASPYRFSTARLDISSMTTSVMPFSFMQSE